MGNVVNEILLTGERGYLGSTVAAALLHAGRSFTPLAQRLETIRARSLHARLVIHCAGALRHRPQDWNDANTVGTEKLLAGLHSDAKIIFVSSRSVYSQDGELPLAETAATEPADGYGKSKLAAECAVLASGRPYLILRPSTLFGKASNGDLGQFNFPAQALRALAQGDAVTLFEPDRETDFLDVQAFARAMVRLADSACEWNRVYNLAGPRRSLHGLIQTLAQGAAAAGWPSPRFLFAPGPPPRGPVLDTQRWDACFGPLPVRRDREIGAEMIAVIAHSHHAL